MAIKDGLYGYVGGTVARGFDTKNGPAAVVEVLAEGSKYPDRVTVWGAGAVGEGDRVKFKGWLRAKPREYTKQDGTTGHGVEVSLNGAELVEHERAGADAYGESAPL